MLEAVHKRKRQGIAPGLTRRLWVSLPVVLLFLVFRLEANGDDNKAHRVIAGMIGKMPAFTKWPKEPDFMTTKAATLAVLTERDDTFTAFKNEMEGRQASGLTWHVTRIKTIEEGAEHRFIFFGKDADEPSPEWYRDRQSTGVLTFGEKETDRGRSVIFSFVVVKSRLRFDVDMVAARDARITVDPRLLKLARKVRTTP